MRRTFERLLAIVKPWAYLLAFGLAACADEPRAPQGTSALRERMRVEFKVADADDDENLTREEVQKGMPKLFAHFDEIDTDHNGKLNFAEIWNYVQYRGIAEARPRERGER